MSARRRTGAQKLLVRAEELLTQRALPEALAEFSRAERLGADADRCAAGRWMCFALAGALASAWHESDAIRARGGADPHRFWRGEEIRGKRVMLRCLHGMGDAVQMLRYIPLLKERCSSLTIEVAPRFVEIARCFDGVDDVVTWGEGAPVNAREWDVQLEVMELPYFFRTRLDELPICDRYLNVPPDVRAHTLECMGQSAWPRVGIVWAAGEWNRLRSLPENALARLVETPGCEYWSLQGGAEQNDWSTVQTGAPVRDARECGEGVLVLASVIEQMDLVITVDTLAAHLAGALGTPAWVLLQHAADWRWMLGRGDTPWYPSLRLVRQARPDDWSSVVSVVNGDLRRWLNRANRMDRLG